MEGPRGPAAALAIFSAILLLKRIFGATRFFARAMPESGLRVPCRTLAVRREELSPLFVQEENNEVPPIA